MSYDNYNIKDNLIQGVLKDFTTTGKYIDWKNKKLTSLEVSNSYYRIYEDLNLSRYKKKAYRVKDCGSFLQFKVFNDGRKKLHSGDFCKDRLCSMCNWRRSLKIYGQVSKIMDKLLDDKKYRFLFLTLTCKNVCGDDLSITLDTLFYAYKKLALKTKFKKSIKGWFRALEITHNLHDDTFHPHFHVILCVDSGYFKKSDLYITQDDWTRFWKDCMEVDYTPIVDIRTFKSSSNKDIGKSVAESAKYTVKDTDYIIKNDEEYTDRTVLTLDNAMYKRRLTAFGGIFKKLHKELSLDDNIDGDLVNTNNDDEEIREDLNYIIESYKWNIGYSNYVKFK